MSQVSIVYDKLCPVCRLLASMLGFELPPHWQLVAWQDFQPAEQLPRDNELEPGRPRELSVLVDLRWYVGEEAWNYLIASEPRLQSLQHLASKLGLAPPHTARWLRRFAHGIRGLCPACPGLKTLRSRRHLGR